MCLPPSLHPVGAHQVGDQDHCVKYDELLAFLIDGAERESFGEFGGGAAKRPMSHIDDIKAGRGSPSP